MEPLKILIIEDDNDFAEGLAESLELEGHEVEIAQSGEDALSRYKEKGFDLTFLDVRLPGMNGAECFIDIRALNPEAKVIMMSAYSIQSLLDRVMERGAVGILKKPFNLQEAVDLVETVAR